MQKMLTKYPILASYYGLSLVEFLSKFGDCLEQKNASQHEKDTVSHLYG